MACVFIYTIVEVFFRRKLNDILKLLGSLDVLLGVPITVTLVSVAVVTEWLSPIHVCVIGTLARGPLSVVAGTRTPVSSTLDRASGGSLLCNPHDRTHELNVFANRAIGFLVTYSHNLPASSIVAIPSTDLRDVLAGLPWLLGE